jgi:hypothetical protein
MQPASKHTWTALQPHNCEAVPGPTLRRTATRKAVSVLAGFVLRVLQLLTDCV